MVGAVKIGNIENQPNRFQANYEIVFFLICQCCELGAILHVLNVV